LVPIAGGPNAQQALQILPSLLSLSHTPAIQLAQIFHPSTLLPDTAVLEKSALFLSSQLSASVMAIPVRATSVSDAVINLAHADDCDVVVLGASREGMLQQAIKGNIPEAIARGVKSTVILVRSAQ
jgi:CIC family chloride channel protein